MAPGRRRKGMKKPAKKPARPTSRKREPRRTPREPEVFIPPGFGVAASVPALSATNDDGDVYIPPTFGQESREPDNEAWWNAVVNNPPAFYVPPVAATPFDAAVIREYVEELERAGFDPRGTCVYKCGGALSVIGRVRPPVALHHYTCPFWETEEGKRKTPF